MVLMKPAGKRGDKYKSISMSCGPALIGKFTPSKGRDPVPKGKPHFFRAEASPEQSRRGTPDEKATCMSKTASEMSSSKLPVPVIFVFRPIVATLGLKLV